MPPDAPSLSTTLRVGNAPPATAPPRRKVAVLAVHGMGQQAQYETLAFVAQSLCAHQDPMSDVTVRAVAMEGGEFRRAEARLGDVEVHVYEGYWAPLTEGRVTLRDVLSFLATGAWRGLANASKGFTRFAFGKWKKDEKVRPLTLAALTVASLALLSLAIVDVIALAVAAATFGAPSWMTQATLDLATKLALFFVLSLVALGMWLLVALEARRWRRKGMQKAGSALAAVSWGLTALTLAALILVGLGTAALVVAPDLAERANVEPLPPLLVAAIWGGLAAASLLARRVFVQFVGDVAAYVSPQKLDRFADLRSEIKASVKKVAVAVYASRDYESVIVMGHSLGSVVAYDTLNGLLRDDALAPPEARRGVLERTRLLLTFGSPLDKTAFIFATSAKRARPVREALAALSQPLILDERFRTIPWINVWSPADPVSGALDLYGPVENVRDEDATTPFVAHTQYWDNALIWTKIREAIDERSVPIDGEPTAESLRARAPPSRA